MMTMVIIAGGAFMFTMFLMRRTAGSSRRERPDGIRWRGIDWSRKEEEQPEGDDHLRKSQD
jgi:hypothetical protein